MEHFLTREYILCHMLWLVLFRPARAPSCELIARRAPLPSLRGLGAGTFSTLQWGERVKHSLTFYVLTKEHYFCDAHGCFFGLLTKRNRIGGKTGFLTARIKKVLEYIVFHIPS